MYIPFEQLPEQSRIWVYQSNRKFNEEEQSLIEDRLTAFCNQWNTHGQQMPSSFTIEYGQFIIMAVDESGLGASGCSIDSSVRTLRELDEVLQADLLDQGKISYLNDADVAVIKLPQIKQVVQEGELNASTKVFNSLLKTKKDLTDNWLIPASESWLNRYFNN